MHFSRQPNTVCTHNSAIRYACQTRTPFCSTSGRERRTARADGSGCACPEKHGEPDEQDIAHLLLIQVWEALCHSKIQNSVS